MAVVVESGSIAINMDLNSEGFDGKISEINKQIKDLTQKMNEASHSNKNLDDNVKKNSQAFNNLSGNIKSSIVSLGSFVGGMYSAKEVLTSLFQAGLNDEKQATFFGNFTKSAQEVKVLQDALGNLAETTAIKGDAIDKVAESLVKYDRTLINAKGSAEGNAEGNLKIIESIKQLGAVSEVTKIPISELTELVTKFGDKTDLGEKQVRRLESAGIQLNGGTLNQALKTMTAEGGVASGALERLAKTADGTAIIAQNNLGEAMETIGNVLSGALKNGLEIVNASLAIMPKWILPVTVAIGALTVGIWAATSAVTALNIASGGIAVAIGAGVALLVTGLVLILRYIKDIQIQFYLASVAVLKFFNKHEEASKLQGKIEELRESMKKTSDTTNNELSPSIDKAGSKMSKLSTHAKEASSKIAEGFQSIASYVSDSIGKASDILTTFTDRNVSKVKEAGEKKLDELKKVNEAELSILASRHEEELKAENDKLEALKGLQQNYEEETNIAQQQYENAKTALEAETYAKKIIDLQAKKAREEAQIQASAKRVQEINVRQAKEEKDLKEKQAKEEKALSKTVALEAYNVSVASFGAEKALKISSAIISTAVAVTRALSDLGPIAGPILAGVIGGLGAVQIGLIASQSPPPPPKFHTGGKVNAPRGQEVNSVLLGQELVLNDKTTYNLDKFLDSQDVSSSKGVSERPTIKIHFEKGAINVDDLGNSILSQEKVRLYTGFDGGANTLLAT